MPIDTLKAKRRLVDEFGLDDRQAEGIVELVAQSEERGVTKSDLDAAEERIKRTLTNRIYGAAAAVTAVLSLLNYLFGQ